MENNYSSQYSGEQVDAAVEYFLRHSQTEEGSYDYTNTVFCESTIAPTVPFDTQSLPTPMPQTFPFAGTDGNLWYDIPTTSSKNWYQCVLKINSASGKVVSQGSVIKLSGDKGDNGDDGNDGNNGNNGNDGNDGKDGNFTEFRYKRSDQYAIQLTSTQKQERYPEGWSTNWDTVNVESYTDLKNSIESKFDSYLCSFATGTTSVSSTTYFTSLTATPTFIQISDYFSSKHQGVTLAIATDEQEAIVVECYKKFRAIYNRCTSPSSTETPLACNTDYHKVWTDYIDENHFWVLFQINAVIAADGSVVREWSDPQRIQGVDGKPGPKGSNGIDGIPGVNIGIAFTLGTENARRPDSANPTVAPYNENYKALLQAGTKWTVASPEITTAYPYIWVTQCRYKVSKDTDGNDVYTFEDTWSTPQRYTGLNGINKTETVYTRNPIIYPAGLFTLNTTYVNTGTRTPYVYYDGCYYFLSHEGYFVSDRADSNPKTSSQYWTLMEHFEALFAEVGVIANGLVGSAVFNGDYMFSQQGLNQDGAFSTHYEGFLTHYSNGSQLTNPWDENADFTPNYCINFKTGQIWSRAIADSINNATAGISMQVQETINGQLRQAGIDIDSSGVHVTGQFTGTMDGTFNGKVSANRFEVLGDAGTPVIVFDTYKESMGNPSGGVAPDEGTPVLLVNHGGAQYLVSMVKLVTGSSSGTYRQNEMTITDLYTTTSVRASISTQGYKSYHAITKAPSLTLLNSDGTATSNTIAAKLYNSAGTSEVSWSTYLNKYYSGTLVEAYPDKTDLGAGVWAFKVVGSFANVSDVYNGTPTTRSVAGLGVQTTTTDSNGHVSTSNKQVYFPLTAYVYNKISINNGVLTKSLENIATCKYTYVSGSNTTQSGNYRYLSTVYATAYPLGSSSTASSTTSQYFMNQTTSSSILTNSELTQSAAIVGPKPMEPNLPPQTD